MKQKLNTDIFNINKKINNLYKTIECGLNAEETTKRINPTFVAEKDALEVKLMELSCIPEAERKSVEELAAAFEPMANINKLSQKRQKQY